MSAGKCKRGPEVLHGTTSSSSDDDSPRSASVTPGTSDLPSSPVTTDHDYDVSSPGSSSTLSGSLPVVRAPGFTEYSQPTPRRPRLKKKKADASCTVAGDILCMLQDVSHCDQLTSSRLPKTQLTPRSRTQRDPVPMRMRALPQSMWQEPNVPHNVSPATVYPVLPPLVTREGDDITALRPVTPPDDRDRCRDKMSVKLAPTAVTDSRRLHRAAPERTITVADTDLLMKLFDVVDPARKMNSSLAGALRRARSKKVLVAAGHKSFLSGHDPHMVDNITETLFPQLSLDRPAATGGSRAAALGSGTTMVNLQPLTVGDKTIMLPSLSVDQNYREMLSEVVAHI